MKRSLLFRLGIAMSAIFILAVIGTLSSVFIVETAEGFAAAINQSGTLRMQSYRIASSLVHGTSQDLPEAAQTTRSLVDEFSRRLYSPRIHNVMSKGPSKQVLQTYAEVERQWRDMIYPQLETYLELTINGDKREKNRRQITQSRHQYLSQVDHFVQDIHDFVEALEINSEEKYAQLRFIQIVSLILMLLVASVSLYLARISVLKPLRDLLLCANAARRGDFSARSRYLREDELGQLGLAFNVMAEDLSKMYADLEERVRQQTQHLERSNQSLELLYNTSKRLSDSPLDEEALQTVIHDIEGLMGAQGGTICLGQPGDNKAYRLASTNLLDIERLDDTESHCARCLGNGSTHSFEINGLNENRLKVFSTPIRDQKQQHGVLLVEFPVTVELEDWQQRLLETVASHIAMAINMGRQSSQMRMLSLLEERSVIARELHDSLAQSLSYLKIQVSRLEMSVKRNAEKPQILELTQVLRSALNGAYRQLRDLLTTFRLRIEDEDLGAALRETVEEFSSRGNIPIEYVNRIANCRLRPNAEIHVIQIIREALSNVVRHANATWAKLSIECDMDGEVRVLVEDDGTGIQMQSDMLHHYGLPIMQERAQWLGGNLRIEESAAGGTRIRLTFTVTDSDHNQPHETLKQKLGDA